MGQKIVSGRLVTDVFPGQIMCTGQDRPDIVHTFFETQEEAVVSKYGKLGTDVGFVGRWSRLAWGVAMLLPFGHALIKALSD